MAFKVGVTGGIGSGKSTVCKLFQTMGVPVFYADQIAAKIMEENSEVVEGVKRAAGNEVYNNGILNRPLLAELIFNNPVLLTKINELVHPAVFKSFHEWSENQNSPYVIMEAAILIESGGSKFMDLVVAVVAPVEERIERVMGRNNLSRRQVEERIRNQMDDKLLAQKSDRVLMNGDNQMIIPEVLKLHREILERINS